MHERNIPPCLAHDLEVWKKGIEEKSRFLDCLWGELYGSINIAEINYGQSPTTRCSICVTSISGGRMHDEC